MSKKSHPPVVPTELIEEYGPARFVFGPNLRFPRKSFWVGLCLISLGVGFFGLAIYLREAGNVLGAGGTVIYLALSAGLLAIGCLAASLPTLMPTNWLFVCPRGLIRKLGGQWQGLFWDEIARFQDMSTTQRAITINQCRILTTDGREWGWIAEYVSDYPKLVEVLRASVEGELVKSDQA